MLREVSIAFGLWLLNNVAKHEYFCDIVLFDHSPKVIEGAFGNRSLSGYRSFAKKVDEVGIDIVFDIVFVVGIPKKHTGRLESHVLRVAIKFVLFWMFVKLFYMMLGGGHKSKYFKFCGQTTIHPLQPEFYLLNLEADVADLLILVLPLQRYILVRHNNDYKVPLF